MSNDFIAQGIGVFASVFLIASYLVKSDTHLKYMMCIAFSLFSLHYFLLSAFVGMFVNIIDVLRIGSSIKAKRLSFLMYGFIAVYIAIGLYKFENSIDAFPIVASVLGTVSMYKLSGIKFRIVLFAISCLWLGYGLYIFSIGGIITNVFLLFANSLTIYRLHKDKKHEP